MGGTSLRRRAHRRRQVRARGPDDDRLRPRVRTPMIEIPTIGAGGGSIAWVDKGGLLQVGPECAGSDPGPACYGKRRGAPHRHRRQCGARAASTPSGRIGGKLARLDVEAARKAIEAHVARPLGLPVMIAAEAILRVADSRMAGAIRLVSIERGHDPTHFALMPFGGGGALHAGALIKEVGLASALVPRYPGVTSALGCVIADMRHDFVHTVNTLDVPAWDAAAVEPAGDAARGEASARRARGGLACDVRVRARHVVPRPDAHGPGALPVTLPRAARADRAQAVRLAFERAYTAAFGRLLRGIPMRSCSLRTAAVGRRPAFDLTRAPRRRRASVEKAARGGGRCGSTAEPGTTPRLVAARPARRAPSSTAPAILEQPDATICASIPASRPGRRARQSHRRERAGMIRASIRDGAAAATCRTISSTRRAPMAAPGRPRRTSPPLPARLKPLADALRAQGGLVGATHVHAGAGQGRRADHLAASEDAAAVSAKGDFAPGAWGQALVDELQPADFSVEKIAYSAFYMTRLEWVLRKHDVKTLYLRRHRHQWRRRIDRARRACARFRRMVLEDGCAAFSQDVHRRGHRRPAAGRADRDHRGGDARTRAS